MHREFTVGVAACLVLCGTALAQFSQRSGITGIVTDPSGAKVPGVAVTLLDLDRNQTYRAITNDTGLYSFPNLTAGRYQVAVEKEGFRKSLSDVVAMGAQENVRVDLMLQVGSLTESVEVTTTAPLLRTEQSVVGETVDREVIDKLPVLGRNFSTFGSLAPNVSTFSRGNASESWAVGSHYTIGSEVLLGGGGGYTGMYMNGVDINDIYEGGVSYMPSSEAISEVKVDVANFSAANGRDISSMTVQTRSGNNQLHGTGFDYFQNSALNAWNTMTRSETPPGSPKPLLQRNQFGGNLGGPMYVPKLFNGKNKAFFFVNYEGGKENQGANPVFARMPTAAERVGDFSNWLKRFPGDPNYILYDPASTTIDAQGNSHRVPVPNNDLRTVGGVNQSALAMLAAYPNPNGYQDPNNPDSLLNFATASAKSSYNYRVDLRADFRVTQNDNVYFTFSKSHGSASGAGPIFPELAENVEEASYVTTINYARVFKPNLTNEFTIGLGNADMYNLPISTISYMQKPDTLRNKFLQNLGTPVTFGYYGLYIGSESGAGSIGGYTPSERAIPSQGFDEVLLFHTPTFQFSDTANWIKGAHAMKMGFNFMTKGNWVLSQDRGVYFDQKFTRAGSGDRNPSLGGDPLADFELGLPSAMLQIYAFQNDARNNSDYQMPVWGFYYEDKWQVSQKLTATLGLRYDLPLMCYSRNSFGQATMDYSYPGWQLKIPGRAPGLDQRYLSAPKHDIAPRIGLAYRLRPDVVLRASGGVFYQDGIETLGGSMKGNVAGGSTTYNNAQVGINDDLPYYHFSDIFPKQTLIPLGTYPVSTGPGTGYFSTRTNVTYLDQGSMVTPVIYRYMAEVQKGLGSNAAITLTYLGAQGRKGENYDDANLGPYQTGWTSTAAYNNARPNTTGRWGNVYEVRNGNNTFYNAGTIKFEKKLSHGLQILSHYTFSKTVSDLIQYQPEWAGYWGAQYNWHRYLGRGEAAFSHPHRWLTVLTYETPWGRNLRPLAKAAVFGWNLSFITNFESGDALTVSNGVTSARDQEPNLPNLVGNPNLSGGDRTPYHYFNTAAFVAPPQDVKGTAGRGIVRGPGQNNWNISFNKTFKPKERLRTEFRADLFNAFNHTQWSGVDTTLSTTSGNTFGWVTGARDPRVVTLGLRLLF